MSDETVTAEERWARYSKSGMTKEGFAYEIGEAEVEAVDRGFSHGHAEGYAAGMEEAARIAEQSIEGMLDMKGQAPILACAHVRYVVEQIRARAAGAGAAEQQKGGDAA